MPATRIVVSGFEAFGGAAENPTTLVLERLRASSELLRDLTTIVLPVETAPIAGMVGRILEEKRPDLWIGLGLAAGTPVIAVERIAVNVLDFPIPDNAGAQPRGASIVADGPAAYRASLPVMEIADDLRESGVPAKVSNSAGTYLCNQMMYLLLHLIGRRGLATRAGFLHVPAHPAYAARRSGGDMPSMSLGLMTDAVRIAIATSLALDRA